MQFSQFRHRRLKSTKTRTKNHSSKQTELQLGSLFWVTSKHILTYGSVCSESSKLHNQIGERKFALTNGSWNAFSLQVGNCAQPKTGFFSRVRCLVIEAATSPMQPVYATLSRSQQSPLTSQRFSNLKHRYINVYIEKIVIIMVAFVV